MFHAVDELESALGLDSKAFRVKYGFGKPSASSPIVTCSGKWGPVGKRGNRAVQLLKDRGFDNVQVLHTTVY